VFRPTLPDAGRLLPYLRRIDDSRIYTNWGPLAVELERRLAAHFGVNDGSVVSASSGTSALVGAILASAGRAKPARPLAIVPALTFVATAIAVEQCGYQPYVADVDADTWHLDIARIEHHRLRDQIGLVVVAAPFGRPVPQEMWSRFQRRTGIAVVIDGGASFEAISTNPTCYIGEIAMALSFHATKSFATGEGGCIVTTNPLLATLAVQALNFGFYATRESLIPSTNGKMSEYHAAVGLAELDWWAEKRSRLRDVASRYRRRMHAAALADRLACAPDLASCYVLFRAVDWNEARRIQSIFGHSGIDFRLWYGAGLMAQPYFKSAAHDILQVAECIAPRLIGLPVATDLTDTEIDHIASSLQAAVVARHGE
jgi:dTDP-4-amino-4,6-dideoxygalactose transaminase